MRILLFDNFDSFSYNLVDLLQQTGEEVIVVRNDSWQPAMTEVDAVVFSPGPCTPTENGRLMEAVAYYCPRLPVLGVCLGHQAIALHYGAQLVKAPQPVHGKTAKLDFLAASALLNGIEAGALFMRYHSLMISQLPSELKAVAQTADQVLMAFEHENLPVFGVQFHPESILSPAGAQLVKNFVALARLSRPNNYSIT